MASLAREERHIGGSGGMPPRLSKMVSDALFATNAPPHTIR